MADTDHSDAPRLDLSDETREGLLALSAPRIQRHSRLYVRTQQSVRDVVDAVATETGASIVEVIEHAILETYSKKH